MRRLAPLLAASLLATLVLAGCSPQTETRFPDVSPIIGARISANPHPRGTEAFCRTYARQTAGNQYEGNRDSDDSFGSNMFEAQRAKRAGDQAYARCRAGRTG